MAQTPMPASSAQAGAAPRSAGLFARQATGLVREISVPSAVALNVCGIGLAYALLIATQEPFAFPGGSIWATSLIGGAMAIFPILLYGMLTAAMPRTGGEYIFVSRIINPWVGFAANCNLSIWYLANMAFLAYLVPTLGISTGLLILGVVGHNQTLVDWGTTVSTKGWSFGLALAALVLIGAAISIPLRRTLQIVNVLFAISVLGMIVAIGVLLVHTHTDFVQAIQQFGGNYDKVIADAHKAGYAGYQSGVSLGPTILAVPLALSAFAYGIVTAYTGGEVKSASTTAVKGMLYALAAAVVLTVAIMAFMENVAGLNFLGSATYLATTASPNYPFAVPSFIYFYVSVLTNSTPIIALIAITFIAATLATVPAGYLSATRSIFAWAFDRIVPTALSTVNERTRAPLAANAFVVLVAVGYLLFIAFGPTYFINALYTLLLGQSLTFITVAIAGIVLPFRRRALYEGSPIARSVAGIPLISLVGVAALAVYVFYAYQLATSGALGANSQAGLIALFIIVGISIVIYPISYLINRSRGVDLGLAFRDLPPA